MTQSENDNDPRIFISGNAGQFGLLMLLTGGGILLGTIVVAGLLLLDPNFTLAAGTSSLSSLDPSLLRISQVVGTFLQFALPAWMFAILLRKRPVEFYHFNKKSSLKIWVLVVLIACAGMAFSDFLAWLNEKIPVSASLYERFMDKERIYIKQVFSILDFSSYGSLLLSILLIAVFPALFEELLFRGALQPILIRWTRSPLAGIFITSFLFSLIHFSFFGLAPRLFLGMALGYVFFLSKNIWLNIAFHFLNNAIAIIGYFSLSRSGKLDFESATSHLPLYYQVTGTIAFSLLFYFFYKECKKEKKQALLI